jgi:hypothetical protein
MKNNLVVVFILAMLTVSCNPAKKIARQQEQYKAVVDAYNKEHTVRIDTTTKYINGATVIQVVDRIDTIIKYTTNDITGEIIFDTIYTKGKDIHHYKTDTITKTIVPIEEINLLKNLNEKLQIQKDAALLKSEKNKKWFYISIIEGILLLILSVAFFYKILKP